MHPVDSPMTGRRLGSIPDAYDDMVTRLKIGISIYTFNIVLAVSQCITCNICSVYIYT